MTRPTEDETLEEGGGHKPPIRTAIAAPGEDDDLVERLEALSPERLRVLAAAIEERYGVGPRGPRQP